MNINKLLYKIRQDRQGITIKTVLFVRILEILGSKSRNSFALQKLPFLYNNVV